MRFTSSIFRKSIRGTLKWTSSSKRKTGGKGAEEGEKLKEMQFEGKVRGKGWEKELTRKELRIKAPIENYIFQIQQRLWPFGIPTYLHSYLEY